MQSSFFISAHLKQDSVVFSFPFISFRFCLKSLGSEICQLHSSACVLYTEASEVLLEFQRVQLIYKWERRDRLWEVSTENTGCKNNLAERQF